MAAFPWAVRHPTKSAVVTSRTFAEFISCRCCPTPSAAPDVSSVRPAPVADSKQTLLCTYLSGILLVGLLLNSLFGWSWADPIVALVIAGVAVREGREAWRGEHCC